MTTPPKTPAPPKIDPKAKQGGHKAQGAEPPREPEKPGGMISQGGERQAPQNERGGMIGEG